MSRRPIEVWTCLRRIMLAAIWASLIGGAVLGAAAQEPNDPCGLLTAGEVEKVLGEPLAGPPFRASNGLPSANGAACRYQTPKFRAIDVEVEWTDGGTKFGLLNMMSGVVEDGGLKGVITLSNGATVRGAWDEARDFLCCQFNALRGEQLVVIDISSSRATLEQAAFLADLAVQRLDAPVPSDNVAGLATALTQANNRPAIVPACSLVTREKVEEIVGSALRTDPEGNDNFCRYTWSPLGSDYTESLALEVTWRGGLSEMRQAQAAMGQALSFLESEGLESTREEQNGGALLDERAENFIGVMGVRKDVLLSIETGGMNNDIAGALIEAAASQL